MSLRWRLALVVGAVAFVAVALAASTAYVSTRRELHAATDRFLGERLDLLRATVASPEGLGPRRGDQTLRAFERLDAEFQVVGRNGVVVVLGEVALPLDDDTRSMLGDPAGTHQYETEVDGVPYLVRVEAVPSGMVMVGRDLTADLAVLEGLRNRLLLIGGLGTVAAAGGGWLIARRTTRPIERLTGATERVARTEDLTPVPVESDGEVGRLAESFNTMLGALAASREQQRRLVDDASHELRTPLTSLRTNVDLLASLDQLAPEDREALLADLSLELGELSHLVGELVELARDPRQDGEAVADVRLDGLVADVVARTARRTGRAITVEVEPAVVLARPSALERAVSNLVGNAVKFSGENSPVEVRQARGRVGVRDHGPGIDAADRPHVFERFYRADATRASPGSGLGLSIVAQVVADAGGEVFVEDADGPGVVVGFELPVVESGTDSPDGAEASGAADQASTA